jgi:hypothetical protein
LQPELEPQKPKDRPSILRAVFLSIVVMAGILGAAAIFHPDSPLPPEWNPTVPLRVSHDISPLTSWKLAQAVGTTETCLAALGDTAEIAPREDFAASPQCHIRGRVDLSGVGTATLRPIETRCAIALRLAMWERHSLQPAAREILGTDLTRIDHIGSYNCRQMRTTSGSTGRWSTHATADAIDIAGFRFSDGRRLRLIDDWDASDAREEFLKRARDTACAWFRVTLSPDYNSLHADHFHLQNNGWGLCR